MIDAKIRQKNRMKVFRGLTLTLTLTVDLELCNLFQA